MSDHHCLYIGGWDRADWCDQCDFDYRSYQNQHSTTPELDRRHAYELLVQDWCDEDLPCVTAGRHNQLPLTFDHEGFTLPQVLWVSRN